MSNKYGFDFLRSEHIDHDGMGHDTMDAADAEEEQVMMGNAMLVGHIPPNVENKPDLEKQFDILAFLQAHRGSGCLAPNVIYKSTGIDLDLDSNQKVVQMLQHNPKVRVELVPDPENPALMVATYAYQAKYTSVRDRASLLAQINRMTSGIPMRDLLDSYPTVQDDLQALITAGDIIAIYNSEDRDKILFPRGEAFLVELDGLVTLPTSHEDKVDGPQLQNGHKVSNGSSEVKSPDKSSLLPPSDGALPNGGRKKDVVIVETDIDPRSQIRRGEAVQVGGQWFRVSSAVKEGPLIEQPARAQAPLSVVSLTDLSKRNEADGYIRPFTTKQLPLDAPLAEGAIRNLMKSKAAREAALKLAHGRSGGVAGQLFGSHAHSSNPMTLAKSLTSSSQSGTRKRPKASSSSAPSNQHLGVDVLAKAAADPALALYSHARRHGCTKDVRAMYLATRKDVPESDHDLQQLLIKHKLLEPGEQMRRTRLAKIGANVDNDGKPKKRRYYERKGQRMTNTHLEGTEIGAVLARAAEKQKQGGTVGDGGM